MLFSSLVFLSIFFPLVFFIYFVVKKELKNYILLIASLIFYAWGEPRYLGIMLIVIIFNYFMGNLIYTYEKKKKVILLGTIFFDLGILYYFKYYNFMIYNLNKFSLIEFSFIDITMPIGISFFIFQSISYVVDVYRKEVEPQRDICKLALYISLFPQLIAGPIIKYHDVKNEIEAREETIEKISLGILRFTFGLGKKIILANILGETADKIFSLSPEMIDAKIAWLGAVAYSLQLYFDFSGYSDMAIGLGKIFGFKFLENFNYPYISKSITEFWRRWHISLSTWFKEYLYIPLGGNRCSKLRNYLNLFIVFLATGIWHGANWTFIIWGVWHGAFIILEKKIKIENYNRVYQKFLRHIYTIFIFVIGWVFFRSDNLEYAKDYLKVMFGLKRNLQIGYNIWYYLDNKNILILILGIFISISCFKFLYDETKKVNRIFLYFLSIIILIICMISVSAATYNPFIYFRF